MLDIGTVIVSLAAGTLAVVVLRYIQARKPVANYPPGPWGLPIVGNLLPILKRQDYYRYFTELGEKYGSVYSCMLGQYNTNEIKLFYKGVMYGHEFMLECTLSQKMQKFMLQWLKNKSHWSNSCPH